VNVSGAWERYDASSSVDNQSLKEYDKMNE
jgi:hypothetical protein